MTWVTMSHSKLDLSCQHHSNCTDPRPCIKTLYKAFLGHCLSHTQISAQAFEHWKVRKAPRGNTWSGKQMLFPMTDQRRYPKWHQTVSWNEWANGWTSLPRMQTPLDLEDVLYVVILFKEWSFVISKLYSLPRVQNNDQLTGLCYVKSNCIILW